MKIFTLVFITFLILLLSSKAVLSSNEIDFKPTPFANFLHDDFELYIEETSRWITKNRVFRSADPALEVTLNSPFEIKPTDPNGQAILLIHGLSDSPYSFNDIAHSLSQQGFLVRVLLLPGHGGKPADLMLTKIDDWLDLVSHHTVLLMQEIDKVWIGGFSTGANLALIEAIDNPSVAGALLFSPAIVSRKPLDFLAPIAKYFIDWADVDPEESITRFDSLAMNGAALYYESSKLVRNRLENDSFDRPAFVTISESDSVVDGESVYEYFQENFTHPNRQLVWFGDRNWNDPKVTSFTMNLPEKRISTGSHMSVLYSLSNPFYGENGAVRICNNGQSERDEQACRDDAEIWYSSFDYVEENKIHARLTWNPYFDETIQILQRVIDGSRHKSGSSK